MIDVNLDADHQYEAAMAWLTAGEALAALGVRQQTLYANVSRGRIQAKPDPKDPRRSLYDSSDVKRLAGRHGGRRSAAAVAAETIGWGEPVLSSSVSTVAVGRLFYRGRDAVEFAESATLEEVAGLLWEVEKVRFDARKAGADPASPLRTALTVLSQRAAFDPPSRGRARTVLAEEAADLVGAIASAMLGPSAGTRAPLHRRMAQAWRAHRAEDVIRRALVVLADHELNASTFATRVAVSTGASLSAGLLAGLATLSGPLHGGAVASARALIAAAGRDDPTAAARAWLAQGQPLPAFGHPLYPNGDPRAAALLACFTPRPLFIETRAAVEALTGEAPNVDFALAALADAFDLPEAAPFTLFAISRSVGWIAHAIEQATSGALIRPRARYVGPILPRETGEGDRPKGGGRGLRRFKNSS
jgi:citrate synthase